MAQLNLVELAEFAQALPLVNVVGVLSSKTNDQTDTLCIAVKGTCTDFRIYGFNGDGIDDAKHANVYGAILTDGKHAKPHEAASKDHRYTPGWASAHREDGLVYLELMLWLRERGIPVYHQMTAL